MFEWLKRIIVGKRKLTHARIIIDVYPDTYIVNCEWPDIREMEPSDAHEMAQALVAAGFIITNTPSGLIQLQMAVSKFAKDSGNEHMAEFFIGTINEMIRIKEKPSGKKRSSAPVVSSIDAMNWGGQAN
jgi:hypothetical protein